MRNGCPPTLRHPLAIEPHRREAGGDTPQASVDLRRGIVTEAGGGRGIAGATAEKKAIPAAGIAFPPAVAIYFVDPPFVLDEPVPPAGGMLEPETAPPAGRFRAITTVLPSGACAWAT